MDLFRKYDVFVVSDEIWSDLILAGYSHTPTQSVSEDAKMRTVALYAPSKTFNLAGLIGSYHIVYNSWIRERMEKESSLCHYNEMNALPVITLKHILKVLPVPDRRALTCSLPTAPAGVKHMEKQLMNWNARSGMLVLPYRTAGCSMAHVISV